MSVKQVVVIRKDLQLRRGKEIAQSCHSSIAFLLNRIRENQSTLSSANKNKAVSITFKLSKTIIEWMESGCTKICVQVNSEAELLDINAKAHAAKIECHLITDAGRTEFHGVPTKTCLALGPHDSDEIDKITGHLKLY